MKKLFACGIIVMCVVGNAAGCASYAKMENSVKEKATLDKMENESQEIAEQQPVEPVENSEVQEEGLAGIGDSIEAVIFSEGSLTYTLKEIQMFDSVEESGLTVEQMMNGDAVARGTEAGDTFLLMVTANIKNNHVPNGMDSDQMPLFVEGNMGTKADIEDKNGPFTTEAVYFSAHGEGVKDYWKFVLADGEEKEIKLAWNLPKQMKEETLYWIINFGGMPSGYQFFQLN